MDDLKERLREGCKYVHAMDLPRGEYNRQIAMSDALARIEALEAKVKEAGEALTAIQYEAERENGGWVHLKRCIAAQTRAILAKLQEPSHDDQ